MHGLATRLCSSGVNNLRHYSYIHTPACEILQHLAYRTGPEYLDAARYNIMQYTI